MADHLSQHRDGYGSKPGVVKGRVWETQQFLFIRQQISPEIIDSLADSDEETETESHLYPNWRYGPLSPSLQLHDPAGLGSRVPRLPLKML